LTVSSLYKADLMCVSLVNAYDKSWSIVAENFATDWFVNFNWTLSGTIEVISFAKEKGSPGVDDVADGGQLGFNDMSMCATNLPQLASISINFLKAYRNIDPPDNSQSLTGKKSNM